MFKTPLVYFLWTSTLLFGVDVSGLRVVKEKHKPARDYYSANSESDWWHGRSLLGHDNLTKERLAQAGITILASFTTDMFANPIGGKAQGFAYAGSYDLSININFDRTGWEGFELFSSADWRTGTSLSQRKIDNQFNVAQVFGSQTVKFIELYFQQILFQKNFLLKAGRLCAGNDFFASTLYSKLINNGFNGNPVSIFYNVPFTAYPNATWGAYLMFKPYKRLSAKFAAFNANSNIKKDKYHGVNFTFKSTNGVIWITEWCALVNQEKEDRGMPGNYKVGYFYLTGSEPKFTGGEQRGDPCFYLLFDQMIYRWPTSNREITPFISLIFQPQNRNLFPIYFNCGLVTKGPLSQRQDDFLSLGYIYGKYSRSQASVQSSLGLEPQNFESILELNYWAQINKWFYITPDIQYVIHPKGRDTPNAFVIGAEIGISIW